LAFREVLPRDDAHHGSFAATRSLSQGEGLDVGGAALVTDCEGALYWPDQRLLAVADLHLEKGSGFASRGSLLPPYDTADTLCRLARVVARYAPRTVVALGDNFHDGGGGNRIAPSDRTALAGLQSGREWIWIAGNHDPRPMAGVGGEHLEVLKLGMLTFRHAPSLDVAGGEISGHLHPVAVVVARGRGLRRRCFISNAARMVMPAFGAYAGGLNVRHRAFAAIFGRSFIAHVMGRDRVYALTAAQCAGD
jgi:DNA ligase-associated metallophosphoesterase